MVGRHQLKVKIWGAHMIHPHQRLILFIRKEKFAGGGYQQAVKTLL